MREYINFNAGPSMLPYEVLLRAKDEFLNFKDTNISPLEIGHRSKEFQDFITQIINKLRNLLNVPNNYKVILLQGGAQAGFSMLPFYYMQPNRSYDYVVSGLWSYNAYKAALKYGHVNKFEFPQNNIVFNKNSIYGYLCTNETAHGIMIRDFENPYNIPIINDITSCITALEIDISQFGVLYASSQKNLGIPGATIYIVRDDLMETKNNLVPDVFNFEIQYARNSCQNTVQTYTLYIMDLMLDWINQQGGVKKLHQQAQLKSSIIYNYIDSNDFYENNIDHKLRSEYNVIFQLKNRDLLTKFLQESKQAKLLNLKGHEVIGGVRVSLYNAIPLESIYLLISFMDDFRRKNS